MHLEDEKFNLDREAVIKKIWNEGVTIAINMGCDLETSQKAIEIANNNKFIYASVGLHPENIPQKEEELWITLEKIKQIALNNKKFWLLAKLG